MTGQRECADSVTTRIISLKPASRSTTTICARGTMMSRTCISETCSTPSIMPRASGSSRLRCWASRSSVTSCSRSFGSPSSARLSRSNQERGVVPPLWGRSTDINFHIFINNRFQLCLGCRAFARVRIGKTQTREDAHLAPLHRVRLFGRLVVVSQQMQYTVYRHVRPMGQGGLALLAGLARHHGCAEHHDTQQKQHQNGKAVTGKGEDVGGAGTVAIGGIERGALVGTADAQTTLGLVALTDKRGLHPPLEVRRRGNGGVIRRLVQGVLHIQHDVHEAGPAGGVSRSKAS